MGSGPRAGLAELRLPELQKGSSIMPGKVNPVIPEVVIQVAAQVIGNDTAITVAGSQGQFELNVRVPLIARNLLDSIKLLASASRLLDEKCVTGLEANEEMTERHAEATLATATALNPHIGYDRAADIVKAAAESGRSLREVALEQGVEPAVLEEALDHRRMARPHRACLAFFGNLLPEEDVRTQIALATGISAANDYGLLERFGGDVAGAVTLLPADGGDAEPQGDSLEILSPRRLDEVLTALPQRPLAADEDGEVRLSLAGAQSKLPVVETDAGFALPHGSGRPTTHILKPEPRRFPGLVANELFCMRLAADAGLEVAAVDRGETESGLPFLIVSRYDRDLTQEPIRRLHQEDFCQALGKLYIEKYQQEGGPSFGQAMELIDDVSSAPARTASSSGWRSSSTS